ncbi:hypothetical protein BJ875DRAFT_438997 [Amylocarpus encephaloides]|uniref:Fungal N-terminal domain-containing protein n=1 Tax=Amylocarpus encephaloides TaxID=45428 RepID=A0A9P7YNI1_9HELO|nr:hypothetical protein BJ875DRAFT_438997 [Amylocarpus encephaloides]
MDPLSIPMAIIGILTAAQKISGVLVKVSGLKAAPLELQQLRTTADTIRSALHQLQLLLLGRGNVSRQRTSLILVNQVVVTLSACVTTFSELDVFVGLLDSEDNLGIFDSIWWISKASTIKKHLEKLEMHKTSLPPMMTILTYESTFNAEDAVEDLATMVQQVLDSNQVLAQRLGSITNEMNISPDTSSQETVPSAGSSRVLSINSSTLSLSDVSVIAVQALPIYAEDLSNREVYAFGEFGDKTTPLRGEASSDSKSRIRILSRRTRQLAASTVTFRSAS